MNFFTRIFKMPTSAVLYHLSQTHLNLGEFPYFVVLVGSFYGLFLCIWDGIELFLSLELSVFISGGEMFLVMVA